MHGFLLETHVMPSPSSLTCLLFPHTLAAGCCVAVTGMLHLLFKDSQLSGQDTQVRDDSLIHPAGSTNTTFQIYQSA